jgi:SAM-dependent methyltransferase
MIEENFYLAFEDKHRGPRKLIKERLQVYLPFVEPLLKLYPESEAIDLGCGRGEWLELLNEAGFKTTGIDLNQSMITLCQQLGLNAKCQNAIEYLKTLPNDSQTIISGFHIAEHISFDDLRTIVEQALRILKPAGLLILETPNPENIIVGTTSFYLDPTHNKPIPPALFSFLPEHYGYAKSKILRLQEPKEPNNHGKPQIASVLNDVSPDYAIVAQKNADKTMLKVNADAFEKEYGLSLKRLSAHFDQQTEKKFNDIIAQQSKNETGMQEARSHIETLKNQLTKNETLTQKREKEITELQTKTQIISSLYHQSEKQCALFQVEIEKLNQEKGYMQEVNMKHSLEINNLNDQLEEKTKEKEHLKYSLDQKNSEFHSTTKLLNERISKLETEKNHLQQNCHEWYEKTNHFIKLLEQTYASNSWRITYPIRFISALLRKLFKKLIKALKIILYPLRLTARWILKRVMLCILNHEKGCRFFLSKETSFPKISLHLRNFYKQHIVTKDCINDQATENTTKLVAEDTIDWTNYSHAAKNIYDELISAREQVVNK